MAGFLPGFSRTLGSRGMVSFAEALSDDDTFVLRACMTERANQLQDGQTAAN
jgi:hypothetical protein